MDDFRQAFAPQWEAALLADGVMRHRRASELALSETMNIVIGFHQTPYRTFTVS